MRRRGGEGRGGEGRGGTKDLVLIRLQNCSINWGKVVPLITVICCPNKRFSTLSTMNIITLNAGNHISLSKPQPALLIVFGSRTDYPTR